MRPFLFLYMRRALLQSAVVPVRVTGWSLSAPLRRIIFSNPAQIWHEIPLHNRLCPMMFLWPGVLWIPATIMAAAAQTARNAMQRSLISAIGTVGATQVRFLYGLPFAIVFLALVAAVGGEAVPIPGQSAFLFTLAGAVSQIVATALMLVAMRQRSFAVTTAVIKTEPVLVAVVGLALLGDTPTPLAALGIGLGTLGVVLLSLRPGMAANWSEARPILLGVAAGGFFALSAVGFRGAITGLPSGSFVLRASTILVLGLTLQTTLLVVWMLAFDRRSFTGSLRVWRSSLLAGFLGAFASQFWFIGFSLTSAANVRTLALVEVLFAQGVSRKLFGQDTSPREWAGMGLIVLGVGLLLAGAR